MNGPVLRHASSPRSPLCSWKVFDNYSSPKGMHPLHLVVFTLCTTYHNQRHSFSFGLSNHARQRGELTGEKQVFEARGQHCTRARQLMLCMCLCVCVRACVRACVCVVFLWSSGSSGFSVVGFMALASPDCSASLHGTWTQR